MTSEHPTPFSVGTVIAEKYRLVRLLGEGGMGQVFEAHHTVIGRRFAIKFLHPFLADNEEITARFHNEAQAAGKLENENIAAALDFGTAPSGALYLVMEFLEGEDLRRILTRDGALPIARTVGLLIQACRGLAAAHARDIIHRDLKPENLFVVPRADGEMLKILDFGIAKLRGNMDMTRSGATMGTPCYMSIEQARGAKEVDTRTDIYALGVIAYECLSGQKAFSGDNYAEVLSKVLAAQPFPIEQTRRDVPIELAAVVRKAMARDADHRFASVAELAEALIPFAGRQVTPIGPALALPTGAPSTSARTITSPDTGDDLIDAQLPDQPVASALPTPRDLSQSKRRFLFLALGLLAVGGTLAGTLLLRSGKRSSSTRSPQNEAASVSRPPDASPPPPVARAIAQVPDATIDRQDGPPQRPGGRPPGQGKALKPTREPSSSSRPARDDVPTLRPPGKRARAFDRTNPYEN